jgi:hypothetical protein
MFNPSVHHGKETAVQCGKHDGKRTPAGHSDHPHRLIAKVEVGLKTMPMPRPAAPTVVGFGGHMGSNVFMAHRLMIENL